MTESKGYVSLMKRVGLRPVIENFDERLIGIYW